MSLTIESRQPGAKGSYYLMEVAEGENSSCKFYLIDNEQVGINAKQMDFLEKLVWEAFKAGERYRAGAIAALVNV